MDRPEWVAANPKKVEAYCALTNNKSRGIKPNKGGDATPVGGPNPREANKYGQIVRCFLDGSGDGDAPSSVIVKHVQWPAQRSHPRGWTTDRSHARKLRSYQVETVWYERYAQGCGDGCRVPACLAVTEPRDGVLLVLEDLDASGFPDRRQRVGQAELDACLSWLANFHATFLGEHPDGLWEVGTYWHLDTRPDELDALDDGPLKSAAESIDHLLSSARFRTLVHGDAKLANFCFRADGQAAAAVDFQYVGGGCGMKDVAYFISSCFDEDESERQAPVALDRYFALLRAAIARNGRSVDVAALEAEWRALYPVAWTDFTRFLHGWSPGHWKLHSYSARLTNDVLRNLTQERP